MPGSCDARAGGLFNLGLSPCTVTEQRASVDQIERRLVVRGGKRVVHVLSTFFHDLQILTPCPIPSRGPGILVCNHISSLDPILLQAACPRVITWMMAKEYSIFGLRWFLNAIEPILVERSGRDMAATRAALRALKDGKLLGLFPEGRIATAHELLEFQTGIALLAQKSGAPVYPAYLDGSARGKGMLEAMISPQQATLAFGPPIQLDDQRGEGRESLEAATQRIRDAVTALAELRR
jgi:1-acyl-sn-glycerol-3-phosphate acyltransferase